jgi:hypothetical protein
MKKKEYMFPAMGIFEVRNERMLNDSPIIPQGEDDETPGANERRNVSSSSHSIWGDSGRKESLW